MRNLKNMRKLGILIFVATFFFNAVSQERLTPEIKTQLKESSKVLLEERATDDKSEEKFKEGCWIPLINCFVNGCGNEAQSESQIRGAYNYILPNKVERNKFGPQLTKKIVKREEDLTKQGKRKWLIVKDLSYLYYYLNENNRTKAKKFIDSAYVHYHNIPKRKDVIHEDLRRVYGISNLLLEDLKRLIHEDGPDCLDKDSKEISKLLKKQFINHYKSTGLVSSELFETSLLVINSNYCQIGQDALFLSNFFISHYYLNNRSICDSSAKYFDKSRAIKETVAKDYFESKIISTDKFDVEDYYHLAFKLSKQCALPEISKIYDQQVTATEFTNEINEELEQLTSLADSCNFLGGIERIGKYGEGLKFYVRVKNCVALESKSFIMPTGAFKTKESSLYIDKIESYLELLRRNTQSNEYKIDVIGLADAQSIQARDGYAENSIRVKYEGNGLKPIEEFSYQLIDTLDNQIGSKTLELSINSFITDNYELAAVRAHQLLDVVKNVFPIDSRVSLFAKVGKYNNNSPVNPSSRGVKIMVYWPKYFSNTLTINKYSQDYHEAFSNFLRDEAE